MTYTLNPQAFTAACQQVGAAVGVEFVPTPTLPATIAEAVAHIAQRARVRYRQVALSADWWARDNGPLLAFRDHDKTPLALLLHDTQGYWQHDPTSGARQRVTPELAATLDPFAYTFFRPLPNGPACLWTWAARSWRGAQGDALRALGVGAALGGLSLLPALLTAYVFDQLIPQQAGWALGCVALALGLLALVAGACQLLRNLALLRLETRFGLNAQAALWDRLLKLPVAFFTRYAAGDLAARLESVDNIRQSLASLTAPALLTGAFSLVNFGVLIFIEARLALLALGFVGLVGLVTFAGGQAHIQSLRQANHAYARLAGLVFQLINGVASLRAAEAEARALAVWAARQNAYWRWASQARQMGAVLTAFNTAVPTLALTALFAFFVFGLGPTLSMGAWLAALTALTNLIWAIVDAAQKALGATRLTPAFENLQPVLAAAPEVPALAEDPGSLTGHCALECVTFAYPGTLTPVLQDVSIEARPGEFVALVGPSGSGKSTVLRLLLGFETPTQGRVLYADRDLATLDLAAVRRQLGVVLQNSTLTPGNVYTNIAGAIGLSFDAVWEAAELAGIATDLKLLPMSMHTFVGGGQLTFSEGQKQRLLLARALARRPRLLFLDEATRALDNTTQTLVMRNLAALQATRLVVAHRLSTIQHADRIYVFDAGRVVQVGTYTELAAQPGLFQALIARQQS